MNSELISRHDRHLRLAHQITGEAPQTIIEKFLRQRILVTGAPDLLCLPEGRLTTLTALNLVARFCPKIDICFRDVQNLGAEALALLEQIDRSADAQFGVTDSIQWDQYDAVLFVGRPPTAKPNMTSIFGSGWLAAVSSLGPVPDLPPAPYNPFGPIVAAVLGAADVFKRLLCAAPDKVSLFEPTAFSAYSYKVYKPGEPLGQEPDLPTHISLPPTFLAGAGAVGNAIVYTLREVPGLTGSCAAVDKEDMDDSNLNRCVLAFYDDAYGLFPTPKVDVISRALKGTGLECRPFKERIESYLGKIFDGHEPCPQVVISAVDNNEIRPSLQRLWPEMLIEGATGDSTFQVSRHEHAQGLACLMCVHSVNAVRQSSIPYEKTAAEFSGLSEVKVSAALRNADLVVTHEDIEAAPEEKQAFLRDRVGKSVCSVLADIAKLSQTPETMPKTAAVSFVSMAAGALAAAELVKWASGLGSGLETLFQMDMFFPFTNAAMLGVEKTNTCECCTRRTQIEVYRARSQSVR
jgi:hypothetical protein